MKFRLIAPLLAGLAASAANAADPALVSINPGYSFVEYSSPAALGNGRIDLDSKLFFVDEQVSGGLKSWYVFFDPKRSQKIDATIHFEQPIQALIGTKATLDASNGAYGIDVDGDSFFNDYTSSRKIGLEAGDKVFWSLGGHDLRIVWSASDPGDHIRVFTAVPEPTTYAMLLAGLVAIGVGVRLRRPG